MTNVAVPLPWQKVIFVGTVCCATEKFKQLPLQFCAKLQTLCFQVKYTSGGQTMPGMAKSSGEHV